MTAREQLYEKLSAEYDDFINGLINKTPDKILEASYENVYKADIISCLEEGGRYFDEKEIETLLALENPLAELYRNWLDTDISAIDDISESISGFVVRENERNQQTEARADEPAQINNVNTPTQAVNGELDVGDYVIVTPDEDYGCLTGKITTISGDDVHVNFKVFDYPPWQRESYEEHFEELSGENRAFDELPLEDVVMAPKTLISLNGISQEKLNNLITSYEDAEAFCNAAAKGHSADVAEKLQKLTERLDQNLDDYHTSLMDFSGQELIGMAGKISAIYDAHQYITTNYDMDNNQIEYLLQFQNPLEIITDEWQKRAEDMSDLSFSIAVNRVFYMRGAAENGYPLMPASEPPTDVEQRRFMGVDLIDFLGKIAEKVIVHYPGDWKIDVDALHRAADSDNPEQKRLMWHVSSYGTHINTERDTFIRDTGAFNTWVDYRPNDPDMFGYVVEVTGKKGSTVVGNVYDVGDYRLSAAHVRETASVLDSVSLTYSPNWGVNAGKTITVARFEYDKDRHRLMSESGDVTDIRYHPAESVRTMSDLLRSEQAARRAYPIGSTESHLKILTEKLAEIRDTPEPAAEYRGTNALTDSFMEASVFDTPALFTPARVDRDSIPDGYFAYDIRHGDDWTEPVEVAPNVLADHFGTVITAKPLKIPESGFIEINEGDFSYGDGDCRFMSQFMEKYPAAAKLTEHQQAIVNSVLESKDKILIALPTKVNTPEAKPGRQTPKPKASIEDRLKLAQQRVDAQDTNKTAAQNKKRDAPTID